MVIFALKTLVLGTDPFAIRKEEGEKKGGVILSLFASSIVAYHWLRRGTVCIGDVVE